MNQHIGRIIQPEHICSLFQHVLVHGMFLDKLMKSKVYSLSDRSVVVAGDLDDIEVCVDVVATMNRYLFLESAFRLGIELRKDCTCSRFESTRQSNILKKTQRPSKIWRVPYSLLQSCKKRQRLHDPWR